jgi:hypothetical protein
MTDTPIGARLWFGRDPAVLVSMLVAAIGALVALIPMPEGLAAGIAALAAAVGGFVIAAAVKHDGQLPAILGIAKAGMYVLVLVGWNVPDTTQATVLVAIEAVAALFIRQNVTAMVGPDGETRAGDTRDYAQVASEATRPLD